MRLSDFNPRWLGPSILWSTPGFISGVSFDCPHCRLQRIGVQFKNPFANRHITDLELECWNQIMNAEKRNYWDRIGESFETLTLSPSIDVSKHGHWHGSIQNGELI